jgi:hypothetical protein
LTTETVGKAYYWNYICTTFGILHGCLLSKDSAYS